MGKLRPRNWMMKIKINIEHKPEKQTLKWLIFLEEIE